MYLYLFKPATVTLGVFRDCLMEFKTIQICAGFGLTFFELKLKFSTAITNLYSLYSAKLYHKLYYASHSV